MYSMLRFFILSLLATCVWSECQRGWTEVDGSNKCIKMLTQEASYEEAEEMCKREGSTLLTLTSDVETEEVRQKIIGFCDIPSVYYAWLGAKRSGYDFTWENGKRVRYNKFEKPHELHLDPTKNCVSVGVSRTATTTWFNAECGRRLAVVCQIHQRSRGTRREGQPNTSSDVTESQCQYDWSQYGEKCFKLLEMSMTKMEANVTCQRYASQVVDFLTEDESKFVVGLVESEVTWLRKVFVSVPSMTDRSKLGGNQVIDVKCVTRNWKEKDSHVSDCKRVHRVLCEASTYRLHHLEAPAVRMPATKMVTGQDSHKDLVDILVIPPAVRMRTPSTITTETHPAPSEESVRCPDGWKPFESSCYRHFHDSQTYYNAMKFCKSEAGQLPEFESRHEREFVKSLLGTKWFGMVTWKRRKSNTAAGTGHGCNDMHWTDDTIRLGSCDRELEFTCKRDIGIESDTRPQNKVDIHTSESPTTHPASTTEQTDTSTTPSTTQLTEVTSGPPSSAAPTAESLTWTPEVASTNVATTEFASTTAVSFVKMERDASSRCLPDWRSFKGQCYKYVDEEVTHDQADKFCQNVGASLAEINDNDSRLFFKEMVGQSPNAKDETWLKGKQDRGNWWTPDWRCDLSTWATGNVTEVSCDNVATAICRMSGEIMKVSLVGEMTTEGTPGIADDTESVSVCPTHWHYYDDECYKYFSQKQNHLTAGDLCTGHMSLIAAINDDDTQTFLKDMIEREVVHTDSIWLPDRNQVNGQWVCEQLILSTETVDETSCDGVATVVCEKPAFNKDKRDMVDGQLSDDNSVHQVKCPNSWFEFDGHCYNHFKTGNFDQGIERCREQNASMVEINSQKEDQFLVELVKLHVAKTYPFIGWLGAKKRHPDLSDFLWEDGQEMKFTNWYPRWPKDCLAFIMRTDSSTSLYWFQRECSKAPSDIICEKPMA